MGTYGEMQNRIADELGGRSDLLAPSSGLTSSPIQLAILDAIGFYDNERFYFDEYRTPAAFFTVAGQEFYTAADWADIATISQIDKLSVVVSGNRYFMEPRTAQYMEDVSVNPLVTGQPVDYCYYNEQLRFYPIPDNAYAVNVLGTKAFAALSAVSDSNVWTTVAEPMIRARAKMYLYRDTLQKPDMAKVMENAADDEWSSIKGETMKRVATVRFTATHF